MTQIVSAESKAAFKSFVSKLNQIESSGPEIYSKDTSGQVITENYDPESTNVPDFVEIKKDRVAVNVDQKMENILKNFGKIVDEKVINSKENKLIEKLPEQKKQRLLENRLVSTYEIEKNADGRYVTYNIKDSCDGKFILENVNLGKIAVKIVKLLEGGYYINDRDITRLLRLDEDYSFYYGESEDAKEQFSKSKKVIHEHRFHYAKGQVDLLEKQIHRECL